MEALGQVKDPEIGLDIVNLGMVYDVKVDDEGKDVDVKMTLTTMGCPIFEDLASQIQMWCRRLPGVENVRCELVWDPPWSPDLMSDEAKLMFKYLF